ncbi:hypothetical protein TNCV_4808701 [Trichonephila clavipes]|nr:hypothetical protein TNCV_4808701 [Trichonephila clavipes]
MRLVPVLQRLFHDLGRPKEQLLGRNGQYIPVYTLKKTLKGFADAPNEKTVLEHVFRSKTLIQFFVVVCNYIAITTM